MRICTLLIALPTADFLVKMQLIGTEKLEEKNTYQRFPAKGESWSNLNTIWAGEQSVKENASKFQHILIIFTWFFSRVPHSFSQKPQIFVGNISLWIWHGLLPSRGRVSNIYICSKRGLFCSYTYLSHEYIPRNPFPKETESLKIKLKKLTTGFSPDIYALCCECVEHL